MHRDRPEVGEQAERSAQLEQPLLRPNGALGIPFRTSHRPEKHRGRALAQVQRGGGKWRAGAVNCLATDRRPSQLEGMDEAVCHCFEHAGRLADHLWSDAVARQNGDQCAHRSPSKLRMASCWLRRKPSSSIPFSRQWRANESMEKPARVPSSSASVCSSRLITTLAPGAPSKRRCIARSTTAGSRPYITALRRKMSAIEQLTTARKP